MSDNTYTKEYLDELRNEKRVFLLTNKYTSLSVACGYDDIGKYIIASDIHCTQNSRKTGIFGGYITNNYSRLKDSDKLCTSSELELYLSNENVIFNELFNALRRFSNTAGDIDCENICNRYWETYKALLSARKQNNKESIRQLEKGLRRVKKRIYRYAKEDYDNIIELLNASYENCSIMFLNRDLVSLSGNSKSIYNDLINFLNEHPEYDSSKDII